MLKILLLLDKITIEKREFIKQKSKIINGSYIKKLFKLNLFCRYYILSDLSFKL